MSRYPDPPEKAPSLELFDKCGVWLILLFFTVMGAGVCWGFWGWVLNAPSCR